MVVFPTPNVPFTQMITRLNLLEVKAATQETHPDLPN